MWDKDCASKIHLLELDQIVYFTVPKYMRIVLLCFPELFSIQVWMSKMSDGIKDVRCRMSDQSLIAFPMLFLAGWGG